jgi:hypothetical protein
MMHRLMERAERELTATDDGINLENTLLDDEQDENMDEPHVVEDDMCEDPDVTLDSQQYKQYKSFASVKEHHSLGFPLSFVVATVVDRSYLGCVIRHDMSLRLVPIQIGLVRNTPDWGFPYFETHLDDDEASWIIFDLNDNKEDHPSFVNYGHLLPHLASLDSPPSSTTPTIPYAIVTVNAYHMDATYAFV